jgi:hypothetical protein
MRKVDQEELDKNTKEKKLQDMEAMEMELIKKL